MTDFLPDEKPLEHLKNVLQVVIGLKQNELHDSEEGPVYGVDALDLTVMEERIKQAVKQLEHAVIIPLADPKATRPDYPESFLVGANHCPHHGVAIFLAVEKETYDLLMDQSNVSAHEDLATCTAKGMAGVVRNVLGVQAFAIEAEPQKPPPNNPRLS